MSDDKNARSNPGTGTITFGPGEEHKFEVNAGEGLKFEVKAESVTIVDPNAPAIDVPSLMRASGYAEGFKAGVAREKEMRDALMQASLDLMNLSAFLRLEGKSELADIGMEMSEAALAAMKGVKP